MVLLTVSHLWLCWSVLFWTALRGTRSGVESSSGSGTGNPTCCVYIYLPRVTSCCCKPSFPVLNLYAPLIRTTYYGALDELPSILRLIRVWLVLEARWAVWPWLPIASQISGTQIPLATSLVHVWYGWSIYINYSTCSESWLPHTDRAGQLPVVLIEYCRTLPTDSGWEFYHNSGR